MRTNKLRSFGPGRVLVLVAMVLAPLVMTGCIPFSDPVGDLARSLQDLAQQAIAANGGM